MLTSLLKKWLLSWYKVSKVLLNLFIFHIVSNYLRCKYIRRAYFICWWNLSSLFLDCSFDWLIMCSIQNFLIIRLWSCWSLSLILTTWLCANFHIWEIKYTWCNFWNIFFWKEQFPLSNFFKSGPLIRI